MFWETLLTPHFFSDPLFLLLLGVAVLLLYRLISRPGRNRRQRLEQLRLQAAREPHPARRRELVMEWNEMGGYSQEKKTREEKAARILGQKARISGEPVSANPFGTMPLGIALGGQGKQWRQGWKSVDRNIRWLARKRKQLSA